MLGKLLVFCENDVLEITEYEITTHQCDVPTLDTYTPVRKERHE